MRPIDADALKEIYTRNFDYENCIYDGATVVSNIDETPTVDAEPVRHGKWKQWDSYGFEDTYKCMACGESFVLIEGTPITNGYKYCPYCGATMDAERKEE